MVVFTPRLGVIGGEGGAARVVCFGAKVPVWADCAGVPGCTLLLLVAACRGLLAEFSWRRRLSGIAGDGMLVSSLLRM